MGSDLWIAVRGRRGNLRDHVPVLDDLAVRVETENVDALAAERPVGRNSTGKQRVSDHEVAVGEDALDATLSPQYPGRNALKVAFSLDGKMLAAADDHGTIFVWNISG
jgi:hypothetical protein